MSDVTIVKVVNEVTIGKAVSTISNVSPVSEVAVATPGPQGPPGPAGADGAAGAPGGTFYIHTQAVASSAWVINHGAGRKVSVTLFDDDGNVILSDIEHGTINQATVTWSLPTTGSALVV